MKMKTKMIQFVYTLERKEDLKEIKPFHTQIIIRSKELSRFGQIDFQDLSEIAKFLSSQGRSLFLEWDILMTEFEIKEVIKKLETLSSSFWDLFAAIRVQDVGAFAYVKEKKLACHLILENGNHNIEGILKWLELGGENLKRLVLSRELSKHDLLFFSSRIGREVDLEYQVFGKIPLFYSRRALLSPIDPALSKKTCLATSEESPHKGFSLFENEHGTYMWLPKELYLLDQLEELEKVGVRVGRIEGLIYPDLNYKEKLEGEGKVFIRGFFPANKTDAIFRKLKNEALKKDPEGNIGLIVDVIKPKMMGLLITHPSLCLKLGQTIEVITPQGKRAQHKIYFIKNSRMQEVNEAKYEDLVYINFIRGVTPQTLINKVD